ncbi:unnamed protein product [Alopecurus aequalis]
MDLQRRWSDLLPDLLLGISGRLNHAVDFVRFHAVCRPWRDSTATATTRYFLPWLLAPNMKNCDALRLTCVFSKTSYSAPPLPKRPHWVANADGTAVQYLSGSPFTSLRDPLTGVTSTLVPPVPKANDRWFHCICPQGVLYRDGTILLYNKHHNAHGGDGLTTRFRAAIRRPGDTAWTVVERTLEGHKYGKFCVAYHGGNILVSVQASQWHMVMLDEDVSRDHLIPSPSMPTDNEDYYYKSGHVLESHGEMLWASIHVPNMQDGRRENISGQLQTLSLSVHALEEEVSMAEKVGWVRKDGKSLADRVFFLGWSNSFSVDAATLGIDGGYAYFVHSDGEVSSYDWAAVIRYNLIDNKAELVEWLPQGWCYDNYAWILPHPTIAPIHDRTM